MATSTKLPDVGAFLTELTEIEGQVAADKAAGHENRNLGRAFTAMSKKVLESRDVLEELGAEGDIAKVAEVLSQWAEVCNPTAETTWKREEITAKLGILENMAKLGMLSDSDAEEIDRLKEALKPVKLGGGQRAPRTAQERIAGRPERVDVIGPDGVSFSNQAGNVPNSAPNLKTAAVNFIKKATEVNGVKGEVSAEDQKGLLTAAKAVVEGEVTESTYEGITFRVSAETE